ncbi:MAG: PD40 domain-containing protein [Acidobacteria bacterium]|nr:PD40 domain-containing protein [Acidobacteriota bacterium]
MQLTTGPMSFVSYVPGKDGKKIFALGLQQKGELVRYDAGARQFVPFLGGISAREVSFSHDGQWAAYVSFPERILWRSKVDGSQRFQLTFPPAQAFYPGWSPDQKKIAFGGTAPGKPSKIYVIPAAGGTPQQVMPGERYEGNPNWSPDGNSLLFGRLPFLEGGVSGLVALHVLDLRTDQISTIPGSEGLAYPSLSPDGRYIAASRDQQNVMLYDSKTQKWTEAATLRANSLYWSRDGKYIYFDNFAAIYRVRISDRKLEEVLNLKDVRRIGGPSSGLAPDGSVFLVRNIGSEEIYALELQAP